MIDGFGLLLFGWLVGWLVGWLQAQDANDPKAKGQQDRYVPDLDGNYPGPVKTYEQINDTVPVYRKVLSESPDGSVHIASIGITTNMRDLVLSQPDEFSPLNGTELIAKKVGHSLLFPAQLV